MNIQTMTRERPDVGRNEMEEAIQACMPIVIAICRKSARIHHVPLGEGIPSVLTSIWRGLRKHNGHFYKAREHYVAASAKRYADRYYRRARTFCGSYEDGLRRVRGCTSLYSEESQEIASRPSARCSDQLSADEAARKHEEAVDLWHEVDQLPERLRLSLLARDCLTSAPMTAAQVARRFQCSHQTVSNWATKAREILSCRLRRHDPSRATPN